MSLELLIDNGLKNRGFSRLGKRASLLMVCFSVVMVPAFGLAGGFAPLQESVVVQSNQDTKADEPAEIPAENIDGSEVDKKTQRDAANLVKAYQEAAATGNTQGTNEAVRGMEALHKADGKNLSVITWLGYIYTTTGEYDKAIEILEKARGKSQVESVNRSNLRNLASSYYQKQDYKKAIPDLKKLADMEPGKIEPWSLLGSAYLLSEDYAGAVMPLEKALELSEGRAADSIRLDLAIAYQRSGQGEKAVGLFDEMKGGDATAEQLTWMGYIYMENGQLNEAIEALEMAQAKGSNNPAVVNNLAGAYMKRGQDGDRAKAKKAFARLLELVPNNATAAYNLGTMHLEDGEAADAKRYLTQAITISADPFSHNNLGRAEESLGNMPAAAKQYAAASDLRTNNLVFAKNAGTAYLAVGDDTNAVKYLERARANGANESELLVNLASAYGRLGQTEKSQEIMKLPEVQGKMAKDADYWFNLGTAAHKDGRKEDAEAHYRKALEIRGDDIDATNNLGVLLYENEEYEEAYLMFEKLSGLDENSVNAKQNMAACLTMLGRNEEAIEIWKKLIRANGSRHDIRLDLADALWNFGDTPGARFHYAYVLKNDVKSERAMNGIGLWHLLQNENVEAEGLFRKAVRTNRKYLPAYHNLAISLERLNRVPEAIKILEAALQVDATYEEAKKTLARLKSGQ